MSVSAVLSAVNGLTKGKTMYVIYYIYDEDYLTDFVSCDNCPHKRHCKEQCEDAIERVKKGEPSQYHGTTC